MKKIDPQTETLKRIARTEAYAEKVRQEFAKTVNAILALNKTLPTLEDGVMFSFDAESMAKQKQVEGLLRQLHSAAVLAIKKGITLEWEKANIECDELVKSYFGKEVLSQPMFAAWLNRNTDALEAFIKRSDNGLNLSDRVWQSVRQLRDEMEVAMTVAIGEGDSAASMSRMVRQYLNDPDLMFRRFRYKDENGNWQRKWKKRIKDETTGKYRWIDYDRDSYKVGAGVYKSSAKNAMRVARTETNIAYRRADHERWRQMDFVIGQKIHLSRSHPVVDICDELQGDYPKDFVFDGWHPQCFCFVTPILMDKSEMSKMTDAFLKGEKYAPKGKQIADYPQGFKDWVTEHSEQIAASRVKGTEPYFVKNNATAIDNILNPKDEPLSIADIAAKRHAERTPEKEKQLREYWNKKKAEGDAMKSQPAVSTLMPDELKSGSKYLYGQEYTFEKEFFDLIDPARPIKFEVMNSDSGSYSSFKGDLVHIAGEKRGKASPWERRAVIYHEFGHCIDAQRNLWQDAKLRAMRKAQIARLNSEGEYILYNLRWNHTSGGWYYEREKMTMTKVEYIDKRLVALSQKIAKMNDDVFTRRGITKNDVIEQIGSTRDTIKSLVVKYGDGHSTAYFKKTRMKETEYLAHAFENAFLGNQIFRKYMPDIYAEMIAYIKALKPL